MLLPARPANSSCLVAFFIINKDLIVHVHTCSESMTQIVLNLVGKYNNW